MSAAKRIVLITGGNAGFGFQTVKALYASKHARYDIMVGSRSEQKGQDAVKQLEAEVPKSDSSLSVVQIDVESDDSINKAFESVSKQHDRIDVLINNAGGAFDPQIQEGKLSVREGWNKCWDLNVTSAWIMSQTFAPLLLKSDDPRLLFIASGTSSLKTTEDLTFRLSFAPPKGWPKEPVPNPTSAYRSSKTGMNMMVREIARIFREDGIKVFNISPGFMATGLGTGNSEMLKKMGAIDPAESAGFIQGVVEGERDKDEGMVINKDGIQPW